MGAQINSRINIPYPSWVADGDRRPNDGSRTNNDLLTKDSTGVHDGASLDHCGGVHGCRPVQDAPAIVPRHELHWSSTSFWAFSKSQTTQIWKRIKRFRKIKKLKLWGNGESTITYYSKQRRRRPGTVHGDRRRAAARSAVKALPPQPCIRFSAGWLPSWCTWASKKPTNEDQSLQSMFFLGET